MSEEKKTNDNGLPHAASGSVQGPPIQAPEPGVYSPPRPLASQPPNTAASSEPYYKRYGLFFAIATFMLTGLLILGSIFSIFLFSMGFHAKMNHYGDPYNFQDDYYFNQHQQEDDLLWRFLRRLEFLDDRHSELRNRPSVGDGNSSDSEPKTRRGDSSPPSKNLQEPAVPRQMIVVTGSILQMSETQWEIDLGNSDKSIVNITADTLMGAGEQTSPPASFSVGDQVIVIGAGSIERLDATRIIPNQR